MTVNTPGRRLRRAAALSCVALLLIAALVPILRSRIEPRWLADPGSTQPFATPGAPLGLRDALAAAPMLVAAPEEAWPTQVPAPTGPVIEVPLARRLGPVDVPTGFPATAEGAVAQLAALGVTVLEQMDTATAAQVERRWSWPGQTEAGSWTLTRRVEAFTSASGENGGTAAAVTVRPVSGLVKGVDGSHWVLACVLWEVRATVTVEATMVYGHCERMEWQPSAEPAGHRSDPSGRWLMAAGSAAVPPPSTWPGSEHWERAGWRVWVEDQPPESAEPTR